jgi:two-component system, cell cycle sensor histidine kinase and response regulator CckA
MDKKITVLHLEDNVNDAELVHAKIDEAEIRAEYTVVQTRQAFVQALEQHRFDLVISDFSLPSFNGKKALEVVRNMRPDIPFIFVSGTIGEDAAIESLIHGATDYVLKSRLSRLIPAIKRALHESDQAKERKRAEEALQQSETRFRQLYELAPIGITNVDPQGHFVRANAALVAILGYSEKELQGMTFAQVTHPDDRSDSGRWLQQIVGGTSGILSGEKRYIRKDGSTVWARLTVSAVKDGEGQLLYTISLIEDITESKKGQEALRQSEERFRSLFENASIGIFRTSPGGEIIVANPALVRMLGYTDVAELAHRNLEQEGFEPTYPRSEFRRRIETDGAIIGLESAWKKRDGTVMFVRESAKAIRNAEGSILYYEGTAEDITERKRAEAALKESEEKYKSLFHRNLAATFVSTPEGEVLDCNPAYVQMFGFDSYEQAQSTNLRRLYAEPGKRELVLTTLQVEKKAEDLHLRMVKLDGTALYIIANLVGKFDEHGRLVQKTGYLIDDTKRHLLEKELIQSQKLESLGILAGGIAHDFNNILGILMGHVSLLNRVKDNAELHRTSLDAIDTALKRGTGLVRQLLTFARKSDTVFGAVFVNDIVKELLRLLQQTFPKMVEIMASLDPHLPPINADGGQIHQVLLNLSVNARDAMPAGGKLLIATSVVEAGRVRERFPSALSDNYIAIEVRDSGTGMDEATKTRIFEPFFTTKESGKGTGLGLAVVFGVVQTHKGFIDVESDIGKGSAFHVYLPVEAVQSGAPKDRVKAVNESLGGNETILIVEDEPLLYETTRITLVNKGYRVLYAKDGREAIDVYRQHFKEIQLVFTDLDLPKLSGAKLVETLLEINPTLKIIFASGYVNPEVKTKLLESGAKAFLAKPYQPEEVVTKVREILDAK